MKVLMSSTSYPRNAEDWRGRFIANLAAGLSRRSDLALSIWAPPGELPPHATCATSTKDAAWLHDLSKHGGIAHLLHNKKQNAIGAIIGLLARLRKIYKGNHADVIHINWLQNALPLWGTKTPAVISVLGTDFGLLKLPGMKLLLRAVLRQRRAILAPNAEWMKPELESAFGDLAEICPIPFGVDTTWFELHRKPCDDGKQHWLVITRLTKNKLGDLFEWGEDLFDATRVLHLFGPMQEQIALPSWIQYHGPTYPAELVGTWFPKATGLITLSRHDEGRPQVMLEAMASGLPIIASDLSAHRDFIQHRQTGWLASSKIDFAEALHFMEHPNQNKLIGEAARNWAKKEIGTWDDCAARYAALYAKLLDKQP
ncbi:MAG TPA: glycosyltransferase family 4 protein [Burkholderiaceae bacterium]|jgi:glycosyltransferase involved in cell wall biosynthesis